jgi:hypothetical protein
MAGTPGSTCRTGARLLGCAPAPQTPCQQRQDWPSGRAPRGVPQHGLKDRVSPQTGRESWTQDAGRSRGPPRARGGRVPGRWAAGPQGSGTVWVRAAGCASDRQGRRPWPARRPRLDEHPPRQHGDHRAHGMTTPASTATPTTANALLASPNRGFPWPIGSPIASPALVDRAGSDQGLRHQPSA